MKKFILYSSVSLFALTLCFNGCKKAEETQEMVEEQVDSISNKYYLDIPADSLIIDEYQIKKGDNLAVILSRFDISASKVDSLRIKSDSVFDITKFKIGYNYSILSDINNQQVKYFVYAKSLRDHIVFDLRDTLNVYEYNKELNIRTEKASGEITTSLWNAIRNSGNDIALSDRLADIYAWQIDFFGIGKGDNFKVIYDQAFIDDSVKTEIYGVRGALFNHLGKSYYAIPFMQDSIVEYFDENGESLRKAFLKAPLKFSRISSTFSNARRHPILKIVRPHHGVDYAAPIGTPVSSIGEGTVIKKAFQGGGAGNYIVIRHNSSYETTYMHLSKFAKGMAVGKRVSQGEVIGYVGSTGSSTGPHLDFRVHFQGKPINPLKMESPPSLPVREELRDSFNIVKEQVIRELNNINL
ncbi:MAG: peptidoglycan DD-metalloendopeptidase family protein [Bacteroidales bacterium]|nr:peptidoglycan DD-metalloendopeptidase family protein [Bacteroidales bacterium]